MNSEQLRDLLRKDGVPAFLYNLDGYGRNDERFCLEYTANGWHVYYSERGEKTTSKMFKSEDAACQYIYNELMRTLRISNNIRKSRY